MTDPSHREAALATLLARPIAHRGRHGCGRGGPVENSRAAARAAIAEGHGIECDVQLSRDGEAMVIHDDDLERLTGVAGRVDARDAAALARLALKGSRETIPTLAEFLALIGGAVPLVIEIKTRGEGDMRLADRAMALVAAYSGIVALESFDPAIVHRCHAAGTRHPVGLVGPPERAGAVDESAVASSDFLSWSIGDLARAATRFPDKPMSSWTIRSAAQQIEASAAGAQIVFEGFMPLATG